MTKIKHLEMAAAISNHPDVSVRKGFLGLTETVTYTPTQSPISLIRNDYQPADGQRLQRLLSMQPDKIRQETQAKGAPQSVSIGNIRLEAALSADNRFLAIQLFQFSDFHYHALTPTLFFQGDEAKAVSSILQ